MEYLLILAKETQEDVALVNVTEGPLALACV